MPLACFHCGEPVPSAGRWSITFDGEPQALCCGGCEAVAGTIIAAGLDSFYRQRPGLDKAATMARDLPATLSQAAEIGAVDQLFAEPPAGAEADKLKAGSVSRLELIVEGMHCGACVWLIEQGLLRLPGVSRASVNLSTERASIDVDLAQTSLTGVLSRIARLGYRAMPYQGGQQASAVAGTQRASLQRLFVAGIGMMQVMMLALPAYLAGVDDIEYRYASLLRWAAMVLTTPVLIYSGWPFFLSAWQNLRFARIGIDVPVSIGLAAAFLWSVRATITGQGEVYFDSVAMFVFLLLLARHLQWTVRRRALVRMELLSTRTPAVATLVVEGGRRFVSPASLQPGDCIVVASGQAVPVDGELLAQTAMVDQSILTGESVPVARLPGDPIPAGSFITGAEASLRVTEVLQDSAVSRLAALVARGFDDKPRLVMLADRIASGFVLAVMALALLTWFVWLSIEPAQAWPVAMTVLVVSCPCALSLATPSALSAASGGLMAQGLLLTRADALETLAEATDIVFDKTGTLTTGRPALNTVTVSEGFAPEQAQVLAATLEQGNDHPYARALRAAAADAGLVTLNADAFKLTAHEAGAGVAGQTLDADGTLRRWRLGSRQWCGLEAEGLPERSDEPLSEVYLAEWPGADAGTRTPAVAVFRACFALTDPLRPGALQTVSALQARGLAVHLLSGDHVRVAQHVGASLGIDSIVGGAAPQHKQAFVKNLQAQGKRVVMLGDGMNDAPVLSLADASVAIGQASDLARTAADVVALSGDPASLIVLLNQASATRRIIRQNLLWALVYNLTMIPAAAFGLVPPWAAAIGMAGSSWLVVANAARLWRNAPVSADNLAGRDAGKAIAASRQAV